MMYETLVPQPIRRAMQRFGNIIEFSSFCLASWLLTIWLGKDLSWDLRNYHYFNAWQFLNGRIDQDVLAANLQGFHNPLIELPFYTFAHAQLPDYLVAVTLSLPVGISAFVIWKITGILSTGGATTVPLFANRCLATIAAVSGAAGWCQFGSTSGEWQVVCLCMIATYCILCDWATKDITWRGYAFGPLLGTAGALKLTAVPFAALIGAGGLAMVARSASHGRIRFFTASVVTAALAFIAVTLPWGVTLYEHYQNPLFPYFNGIFHSPFIENANWRDETFLPKDFSDILVIPIRLATRYELKYGDTWVRDPRILIGFIVLVAAIAGWLKARGNSVTSQHVPMVPAVFLSVLFTGGFFCWASIFSIYRYAIGIEISASLLMFLAVQMRIASGTSRASYAAFLLYLPLVLTAESGIGRWRYTGDRYFVESVPAMESGSVLLNLVPGDPPFGYLSPTMGNTITTLKPFSNLSTPTRNLKFQDQIREKLAAANSVYYMAPSPLGPQELEFLRAHGFEAAANDQCRSLIAPNYRFDNYVCKASRVPR